MVESVYERTPFPFSLVTFEPSLKTEAVVYPGSTLPTAINVTMGKDELCQAFPVRSIGPDQ
jgi:hypothetical protein